MGHRKDVENFERIKRIEKKLDQVLAGGKKKPAKKDDKPSDKKK